MKIDLDKLMTSGTGIFIMGAAWLLFWLGPAFFLFVKDPRWGHNFVIPIVFMTVGLASHFRTIACGLVAVISAFVVTIPTLLALWSWETALILAVVFFGIEIFFYFFERKIGEVINPGPRLKVWLNIHLLNFSYIGLLHMSLIFFVSRWSNPGPYSTYLPAEHDIPTTIFNAMLFVLVPLAVMERYVQTLGGYAVTKIGFIWSVLMIVIPLVVINVVG
ncbi:Uncharacterised protein [uncultured archaeon]|nr:Uncharacterised protein [uncultured archaeon]